MSGDIYQGEMCPKHGPVEMCPADCPTRTKKPQVKSDDGPKESKQASFNIDDTEKEMGLRTAVGARLENEPRTAADWGAKFDVLKQKFGEKEITDQNQALFRWGLKMKKSPAFFDAVLLLQPGQSETIEVDPHNLEQVAFAILQGQSDLKYIEKLDREMKSEYEEMVVSGKIFPDETSRNYPKEDRVEIEERMNEWRDILYENNISEPWDVMDDLKEQYAKPPST